MSQAQSLHRSVVLASASPQRLALLHQIGLQPTVDPANVNESVNSEETPDEYVLRLAIEKSRVTSKRYLPDCFILGADTTIELDGHVIGKPGDLQECRSILGRLSAKTHSVVTAVALRLGDQMATSICHTSVSFRPITTAEIDAYWRTNEPSGKAGSYAIQGQGALFVNHVEGSYSNVVGLPVYETAALFEELGMSTLGLLDLSRIARA